MYSAINPAIPRFFPQLFRTAGPLPAGSTPRLEIPPTIAIRPELIPASHRNAILEISTDPKTMEAARVSYSSLLPTRSKFLSDLADAKAAHYSQAV